MLTVEYIKTILNGYSVTTLSYHAKALYSNRCGVAYSDRIDQLVFAAGFLTGAANGLQTLGYDCPISTLTHIVEECDKIQNRDYSFCVHFAKDVPTFVNQLFTAAQLVRMVADTILSSKKQEQYSFHVPPHTWFEIPHVSSKN